MYNLAELLNFVVNCWTQEKALNYCNPREFQVLVSGALVHHESRKRTL